MGKQFVVENVLDGMKSEQSRQITRNSGVGFVQKLSH